MNVKQLEFTDDAKQKSAEYKIKYNIALDNMSKCRSGPNELKQWLKKHEGKLLEFHINQINDIIHHLDKQTMSLKNESINTVSNCPHYTATCNNLAYISMNDFYDKSLPFFNYTCDICGKLFNKNEDETLAKEKGYLKDEK